MNKILIIDDDKELCALIKRSVQAENIEADFCNTGKEGLQKLREQEYQLVVLDVMMPGMDGFETLEEIRKEYSLPILMFTSKNDSISLSKFLTRLPRYSRPMPVMKWPTSGGSPGTRRSILWTAMTGLSIPLACMSRPRRSSLNEWKPFFVCGTLSILCRRSKAVELTHISFLASRLRKLPRPRAYMRSLFASRSSVALNA